MIIIIDIEKKQSIHHEYIVSVYTVFM